MLTLSNQNEDFDGDKIMTKIIDLFNLQVFVKKSKDMCPFQSVDALSKTFIKNILFIAVMLAFVLFFTCAYLVWNLIVMLRGQRFSQQGRISPEGEEGPAIKDGDHRSRISCSTSSFILTPSETPTTLNSEKGFFISNQGDNTEDHKVSSDYHYNACNRISSCSTISSILKSPSNSIVTPTTPSKENHFFSSSLSQQNDIDENQLESISPDDIKTGKISSTFPTPATKSPTTEIGFAVSNEGYNNDDENHNDELKLPDCTRSKRIVSFSSDSPFLLTPPIPAASTNHCCKCYFYYSLTNLW